MGCVEVPKALVRYYRDSINLNLSQWKRYENRRHSHGRQAHLREVPHGRL